MLLFYGLTAGPRRMQQPVFWETLSVPPTSCLRLCDCPSAPDLCLLGTLVLAGEGIRSREWLANLLMPSVRDHQVHSTSWRECISQGLWNLLFPVDMWWRQ